MNPFSEQVSNDYNPAPGCSGNYNCGGDMCISKTNPECDRVADCPNEADEKNCGKYSLSIISVFRMPDPASGDLSY